MGKSSNFRAEVNSLPRRQATGVHYWPIRALAFRRSRSTTATSTAKTDVSFGSASVPHKRAAEVRLAFFLILLSRPPLPLFTFVTCQRAAAPAFAVGLVVERGCSLSVTGTKV